MQTPTDEGQHIFVALQLAPFQFGDHALGGQVFPSGPQAAGFGQPQQHVQVAQAARRLFAIGFQGVRRVLEFAVPLLHFQRFAGEEGACFHLRFEGFAELRKQGWITHHGARLQHGGLHRDVFGRLAQAFGQVAHTGANFQTRIPATADELFHFGLYGIVFIHRDMGGQQDQHIDIGIREQSTSAKAPHGHQTSVGGHTGFLPQGLQMRIAQVA